MRRPSGLRSDLGAAAILCLLTLCFFSRVIARREVFFHTDIGSLFVPMKTFYAERLKQGDLPFWNPYLMCGYPDIAEGQNGPLYPPHLLAFYFLPVDAALTVLLIAHVFLSGLCMYIFARALRLGRPAAASAGFFYMFSGFMFSHFHHPTILFPAAWAPLLLAALELALRWGSWLIGAWAGALLGLQSLVGYPPMVIYSGLAELLYFAARARQAAREFGWRTVALVGVCALGFGSALWMVQAVPTFQWASYATRTYGVTSARDYMLTGSLLPRHLPLFVFPNFLGQAAFGTNAEEVWIWEYCAYVGLLPLLLAGAATGAWRRSWPFALMAAFGLFMALAHFNPLYHLLQYVPGIKGMRVPARYLFLTTMGLCVMAGVAVESILGRCARGGRGAWALIPCFACAAFTLLVAAPARRIGPTPHIWPQEAAWAGVTLAAGGLVLALGYARKMSAAAFLGCCGIVAAADLWSFDYFLTPSVGADYYREPPRVVEFLKKDKSWYRVASWKTDKFLNPTRQAQRGWWGDRRLLYLEREALYPNITETYRLHEMRGYAAFMLGNQTELAELSLSRLGKPGNDPRLVGMLGVKYIITAEQLRNPHLHLVYDSHVKVYRNDLAMPRCFFVPAAVVAPQMQAQLGLLLSEHYWPQNIVVLDRPPSIRIPASAEPAKADVTWVEPRPEQLIVRVECDRPGVLVVPDTYEALWQVFVDGKREELLVANYALRAVALPPGRHLVEFRYDAGLFVSASRVSLLAALFLLGLTAHAAWKGRRRGSGKSD